MVNNEEYPPEIFATLPTHISSDREASLSWATVIMLTKIYGKCTCKDEDYLQIKIEAD